jgi:hypothetical protein
MTRRTQERQPETGGGFLPRSGLVQEPYRSVIWAMRVLICSQIEVWESPKYYTKEYGDLLPPAPMCTTFSSCYRG